MASKRIMGFLSLLLLFNACDDGDLTVETIDFSTVNAVKCTVNDIVYKLNGSEILALKVDDYGAAFVNEPTPEGTTRNIDLNADNFVVYRSYDGAVSSNNICSVIPAVSPTVTEEWTATSGRIEITTRAVTVTDPTTNATTITGYNHYIVFKNISFNKPNGVQVYETFVFGNYLTPAANLPFAFNPDLVQKCPSTNTIYNFSGSEALTLSLPPEFYPNAVGTQTGLVSATNQVTYKLFTSGLNASYFCTTPTPATPAVDQEWNALDGIANVSGIIEVTTTTETASSWRHTIRLKGIYFRKGNSTFYLGDDYLYGSFVTTL